MRHVGESHLIMLRILTCSNHVPTQRFYIYSITSSMLGLRLRFEANSLLITDSFRDCYTSIWVGQGFKNRVISNANSRRQAHHYSLPTTFAAM